jgi:hypothetical protein
VPGYGGISDPAAHLDSLDRRVYTLEQLISSAEGPWTNVFDEIIVGDPDLDPIHVGTNSDPVTGITLAWGAFYDNIYLDVSWVPPTSATAAYYTVDFAKKDLTDDTYELAESRGGILGTQTRFNNLDSNSTYGVRVFANNMLSIPSFPFPAVGYQDIAIGGDATVPSIPQDFVVFPLIRA